MSERLRQDMNAHYKRNRTTVENPLTGSRAEVGENNLTLPQIRDNPRLEDLFFKHLAHLDPNLGEVILQKMLTAQVPKNETERAEIHKVLWNDFERSFIDSGVMSFNKQMALTRLTREAVSDQEVEDMAGIDPRIQEILTLTRNPAEAGRVLRSQLDELAVSDPGRFELLIANFREAQKVRSSDRSRDAAANLKFALERQGFDAEKFNEAARLSYGQAGVSPETQTKLEEMARKQMGWFASLRNSLGRGKLARSRANEVSTAFAREREVVHDADVAIGRVAEIMLDTLNPDTLLAIQMALRDRGTPEVSDTRTVKSVDDLKSSYEVEQREFSDAAIERKHRDEIEAAALKLGKRPSEFTQDERNAVDEPFAQRIASEINGAKRERRATGLFAAVVGWLFGKTVMDIRNKTRDSWNSLGAPAPATA